MRNFKRFIQFFTILFLFSATGVFAQTTSFVYQGKLQDGGQAANGTYQFEFKLFDAAAGGNQIGQTLTGIPATVANGIFAVNLDFGASSFAGAARFLEISVRQSSSGLPYTNLNPRQEITSTPYAVRSLNANQALTADNSLNLGGIAANQYVITTDARMADDRNPLAGSANYIQNTTNPQASSNFNISGDGKANIFSATTQFNIGAKRVLSIPGTNNLFVGYNAGFSNTSGAQNTFVGTFAGLQNTTSGSNTFVGYSAGNANQTGNLNSFFGASSGLKNTTGIRNTFIGYSAGYENLGASDNTFVGANANVIVNNLTFATAIGAGATVDENNRVVLGRANGSDTVRVPGALTVGGNFFASDTWLGDTQVLCSFTFQSSGNGASTPICGSGNGSGAYTLSFCASSARYKTDVQNYSTGFSLINRLRPVSFRWKSTDEDDLGFIADRSCRTRTATGDSRRAG